MLIDTVLYLSACILLIPLFQKMFLFNVDDRITALDALDHPYFGDCRKEKEPN